MDTQKQNCTLRGLYAITPQIADDGLFLSQIETALRAGLRLLQYRDKRRGFKAQVHLGQRLKALCHIYQATLIVNDSVDLALQIQADGVHLGATDESLHVARSQFPTGVIGASCYGDTESAHRAVAQGADYVAFGSMFASPTKPTAPRASIEVLSFTACPVVAIGGITIDNVPDLIAAGADMVAVISDLFQAADIGARTRAYLTTFKELT